MPRQRTRIAAECDDVTLTLKPLLIDFGSTPYAYTPAQRDAIAHARFEPRLSRPLNEVRGPMRITYHDGSAQTRKPADLIVTGDNRFTGWQCDIGLELLAIDYHGVIHRGLCRQGGPIGRITDDAIPFPTAPVTCTRAVCHCATDLMTSRRLGT